MSVSTEVQRTLVKSPPELWSELSNPDALGRHLGELGEIRITSIEPETKVEWEADGASGVVQLKQSGWGTKVTLSVTRDAAVLEEPQPDASPEPDGSATAEPQTDADAKPPPGVGPEAAVETEPVAEPTIVADPEPEADAAAEPRTDPEPEAVASPDAATPVEPDVESEPDIAVAAEPEPRLGFFARLFRRRKTKPTMVVESEPEVVALAVPEPIYPERPPAPTVDLAAELASVEEQMTQQTTELLTGVLDRLGAAHHRPFSRG